MSLRDLDAGQDSFLDIIANLVGVLIILVVVVGAQATATITAKPAPPEIQQDVAIDDLAFEKQQAELKSELSTLESVSVKFKVDRARLEQQADHEKMLAQDLATRRHAMLMQLEAVGAQHEQKKKELRDQLDEKQQQQLKLQSEKIQLVAKLESLEKSINAVSASRVESSVETIDHYPNPIAKTVFSNEVHFRLHGGKIAYVPMDELVGEMKAEIRLKAEKLKQADVTRETVGPIDGFRLQYELGVVSADQTGQPSARVVRFKRFVVQPVDSEAGEMLEVALNEGSRFATRLQRLEPRRTTVSVWVYPNSFNQYSELKAWLHERGFQLASWPLAEDRPISGGPDGFRTSAQ